MINWIWLLIVAVVAVAGYSVGGVATLRDVHRKYQDLYEELRRRCMDENA